MDVTMRFELVTVTPQLAAEWLLRPALDPRSTDRGTVAKYTRAMSEGRWIEESSEALVWTAGRPKKTLKYEAGDRPPEIEVPA